MPKDPNETQTFKSAKGQNIQHWLLIVPMPVDKDFSEYVQEFICTFQDLCKNYISDMLIKLEFVL